MGEVEKDDIAGAYVGQELDEWARDTAAEYKRRTAQARAEARCIGALSGLFKTLDRCKRIMEKIPR